MNRRTFGRTTPAISIWVLTGAVLVGGFCITAHSFDTSRSALTVTAESAERELADNDDVLRTKPRLMIERREIARLLAAVDFNGDVPTTVERFIRELDRTARAHTVRLVSMTSEESTDRTSAAHSSSPPTVARSSASTTDTASLDPVRLDVVVEGRFTDCLAFLRSLARDRVLLKIDLRSIVRASGTVMRVPRLTTAFTVTLYHRAADTLAGSNDRSTAP